MNEHELMDLPKEDLIWMIELLRVSRDKLAADNIILRNRSRRNSNGRLRTRRGKEGYE